MLAVSVARAEEIVLPAGSDQCQSEPTDLVKNQPVGAVNVFEIDPAVATNEPPAATEHEFTYVVFGDTQDYSEKDRLNMGRMRANRFTSNGSSSAQYHWERCFSRHPNVLLILSGHENKLLSGIRTSRGLYGNDVVEINQTYPEVSNSDWLRTYVINPSEQTITVHTYSPQQNRLCDGRGTEFVKREDGTGPKEDYQFATNCPHHFTIDYGRLRAGVSTQQAGITFRTVTDVLKGDLVAGGGGWYEVSVPVALAVEMRVKAPGKANFRASFEPEYRRLWLRQNRIGGLDLSLVTVFGR